MINDDSCGLSRERFAEYKKGSWDVYTIKSCSSTFDEAKKIILSGAKNGTMIISEMQTGGKGRQKRKWASPEGGLWMSIIFRPRLPLSKLSSVTLLCAVAVSEAIEQLYPEIRPQIKWPNDVYINGRKACGILTETVLTNKNIDYLITGIGINANNKTDSLDDDIQKIATSLIENGAVVVIEQLASLVNDKLIALIKMYESTEDISFILNYYISHMLWINEEAEIKNTITGTATGRGIVKGIGENGELVLINENGTEEIVSGELSLRRIL